MRRRGIALLFLGILSSFSTAFAQPYSVSFTSDATPDVFMVGEKAAILLTVRNNGTLTWRRDELFRLAYHWLDERGQVVVRDGLRTELPRNTAPGESVVVCASVVAPTQPGHYELRWDMVHEKHAWFSDHNPENALRKTVRIEPETIATVDARSIFVPMTFWMLTVAPLLLAAYWVRALWSGVLRNADEYIFYTVALGVGSLYSLLHLLTFTIGLSMLGVGCLIAIAQAAFMWLLRKREPSSSSWAQLSGLELAGGTVVLSFFIQWASAASKGIEILGTDAANYHVPHALNFFHRVRPFDFLATPHLYPMGTSIWAAWFFQPFDGPLLVEMSTAPSFLLLCASMCLIFRLLTGRSGLAWAPWAVLVMFASPLPRLSMLMSADLAYAAGFIAVTAVLLQVWQTRAVDLPSILAAGFAAGWLVSSKSTGLFSLALLCGVALVVVLVRVRPGDVCLRGLMPAPLAATLLLFVASGGIWIARNWWMYGSPLAPLGLSILGVTVFPGQSASEMRNYLSVFGDLARYGDEYELGRRFAESVREMFGGWLLPAGALGLLLAVDTARQTFRSRQLSESTTLKLLFTAFFAAAFVVHAYVIAGLPWTSLEWSRGLALRFLLPFAFLYVMLLYSFFFMDGFDDLLRSRIARTISAFTVVGASLYYYSQHQETPGLPPDRWIATLDVRAVVIAAAIIATARIAAHARRRALARAATSAILLVSVGAVALANARDHAIVERRTIRDARQLSSCSRTPLAVPSEHRELYLRITKAQQMRGSDCRTTRFFVVSRFDRPMELHDSGYRNLILDARVSAARALQKWGPHPSACDIVVASKSDIDARGARWLDSALNTAGPYEEIAEYGRFVAYVRK